MIKQSKPSDEVQTEEAPAPKGKGRPTPKRKEQEKRNERPLVTNDRKLARERLREERNKARLGMEAGEERYLPARDKGPQRKFVRAVVDARFNLGEFMIPVMVLVIVVSLVPNLYVQTLSIMILWAYVLAVVADAFVLTRTIMKRVTAKFGDRDIERGLRWYGVMRSIQMRRLRLPKPQNERGDYPN